MLDPRTREQSPVDLESPGADGRPFSRLRSLTEAAAGGAADLPGLADDTMAQAVLPLDSAKTFVGPNATYYDECWRLMEWRGNYRSWNWAAALTLGAWLAYRRLYGYALIHAAWLILLLLLAANGTSIPLVLLAQVAVAVALGRYGNTLYRTRFREAAMVAAQHEGDHAARLAVLAAAGGIDRLTVWSVGLALLVVAALIVGSATSGGGGGAAF